MTYWKIQFDDGLEGTGWVAFDETMTETGLYIESGEIVNIPVSYHPIEFDTKPDWA